MNTTDDRENAARSAQAWLDAGLQMWVATHDRHVQAAVRLLIGHDVWLRRQELGFVPADVRHDGGSYGIDWSTVRSEFDAGRFATASSTELAVLDLAIELGRDRFRLSRMGSANAQLITAAVAHALGGPR